MPKVTQRHLSSPQRPLCVLGKLGRGKKKVRGGWLCGGENQVTSSVSIKRSFMHINFIMWFSFPFSFQEYKTGIVLCYEQNHYISLIAERSGSPWVIKFGHLYIQEIFVVKKSSVRTFVRPPHHVVQFYPWFKFHYPLF